MKRIYTSLLMGCLLIVNARGEQVEHAMLNYTVLENNEVELQGVAADNPELTELRIHSKFTENGISYTVVGVAAKAFEGNKNITLLRLPETVTRIGDGAFKDCEGLINIIISGENLEIGKEAFANTGTSGYNTNTFEIKGVHANMGERAFAGCGLPILELLYKEWNLGKECFAESRLKYADLTRTCTYGEGCFKNCKELVGILPSVSGYNFGVVEFPESFFEGCTALENLVLSLDFKKAAKNSLPPNLKMLSAIRNFVKPSPRPEIDFSLPGDEKRDFSKLSLSLPIEWANDDASNPFAEAIRGKKTLKYREVDALSYYYSTISYSNVADNTVYWPALVGGGEGRDLILVPEGTTVYLMTISDWYVPDGDLEKFILECYYNVYSGDTEYEVNCDKNGIVGITVTEDTEIEFLHRPSGIEGVNDETVNTSVEVYTLSGLRLGKYADIQQVSLPKGIYIIKSGESTRKLVK